VALRLDSLKRHLSAAPEAAADLSAIERAVGEAITEIRTLSRGLSLPDIDRKPLTRLVQGLVDAQSARTHADIRLTQAVDRDPPPVVKNLVCRTLQEGLSNAWRHGGGTGIAVDLRLSGPRLRLVIADEGPGPTGVEASDDGMSGLGLAGLQGRAEALGGTVVLRPRAGGRGAELVLDLDVTEVTG
jgi:hypothetical protein